jgi:hypothetical protein
VNFERIALAENCFSAEEFVIRSKHVISSPASLSDQFPN